MQKPRQVFGQSKAKGQVRGQIRFKKEPVELAFMKAVHEVIPSEAFHIDKGLLSDAMKVNMQVATWGYAEKAIVAGFEKSMLPTIRVTIQGTRTLLVARFTDLAAHMRDTARPVTSGAVKVFLETAKDEDLKAVLDSNYEIFKTTCGPGDLLYLPTSMLALEKVNNTQDVIGFKCSGLSLLDKGANAGFRAGSADLVAAGQVDNPILHEAVQLLEQHGAQAKKSWDAMRQILSAAALEAGNDEVAVAKDDAPAAELAEDKADDTSSWEQTALARMPVVAGGGAGPSAGGCVALAQEKEAAAVEAAHAAISSQIEASEIPADAAASEAAKPSEMQNEVKSSKGEAAPLSHHGGED